MAKKRMREKPWRVMCHACCRMAPAIYGSGPWSDRFLYHRGGSGKARKRCEASGKLLTVWRGRVSR